MERSTGDGLTLLSDLVGAMAKDRRTCSIRLTDGVREGLLRFEHGRVVEVSFGRHQGASAMVALTQAPGLHHEIIESATPTEEPDRGREELPPPAASDALPIFGERAEGPDKSASDGTSLNEAVRDGGDAEDRTSVQAEMASANGAEASAAERKRVDPDAAGSDAASPDAASPDAASPDAASSDAASSDAAGSDAASPDAAGPDASPNGDAEDGEHLQAHTVEDDAQNAESEDAGGVAAGVAPRRSDWPRAAPKTRPMWGSLLLGALVLSTATLLWTRSRQRPSPAPRAVEEGASRAASSAPAQPAPTEPAEWREGPRALAVAGVPLIPSISLRVWVSSDGRVQRAEVLSPRANLEALEERAIATALKQRYRPAMKAGKPIASWTRLVLALEPAPVNGTELVIKGSKAIADAFGEEWTSAFEGAHPGLSVRIDGFGTKAGFAGLIDGSADLATASWPVAEDELAWAKWLGITLREIVLGESAIAVIVHPDSPLRELDLDTLAQIYAREITSWEALSGEAAPIHALTRPNYAGVRSALQAQLPSREPAPAVAGPGLEVADTESAVIERVASDVHAIGYVSLSALKPSVRALALKGAHDGAAQLPSPATIRERTYPLKQPLLIYLRADAKPEARAFVQFAVSEEGQALLAKRGLLARPSPGPRVTLDAAAASVPQADLMRIYFEKGTAHIVKARWDEFWVQASRLRAGRHALVVSYTDDKGDPGYNRRLARVRANVVRDLLLERMGSGKGKVDIEVGRSEYPIAAPDTPEGESASRRVDVFVSP